MFENLMNLVKEHASEAIINNPNIPNERNDEAIADATNSITNGLQNMLSSGNIKDVVSMFSNNGSQAQANAASTMQGGLVQNLMDKFGLDNNNAKGIAESLIPNVLQNFVQKTNEPTNNGFDLQEIMNNLSGGKTAGFDMSSLLSKFNSGVLDKDGDGDTDLQDIMAILGNKNNSSANSNSVLDTVKGLFN